MTEVWLGDSSSHKVYYHLEQKFLNGELFCSDNNNEVDDNKVVANKVDGAYLIEKYGDTAVINVKGSLTSDYASWHKSYPVYVTSYEALIDALAKASTDTTIARIVLNFATGGGTVRGVDNAGEAIRRANLVKPVIAHTDTYMFSAGYWLAANAGKITASRMAEVGSIGTLMVLENYKDAAEQRGVKHHVFRAGDFKALGLPVEELTQEAKDYLQANLDKTNKFFIDHVSQKRNLMVSERKTWADGKVFFAEEALSVGLIDKTATLFDLIPVQSTQQIDARSYSAMDTEKIAQIAAGVDPVVVMGEQELQKYEEAVSAQAVAEVPAQAVAEVPAVSELTFAKQVGKLEAKLEATQEELAKFAAKQAEVDACMQALMIVAQAAVGNMQNALRKPKESKSSPMEVVAQYNDLQKEMADTFKRGQQTVTPVQDTTTRPVTGNFRSI